MSSSEQLPFHEQLNLAINDTGIVSTEQSRFLTETLGVNLEIMTLPTSSPGTTLDFGRGSISWGGGATTSPENKKLIESIWKRLESPDGVDADHHSASEILSLWMFANTYGGSTWNGITNENIRPHREVIQRILTAPKVEEAYQTGTIPQYLKDYRSSVLTFLEENRETENLDLRNFPRNETQQFLYGFIQDDSTSDYAISHSMQVILDNKDTFAEFRKPIFEIFTKRFQQAVDQKDYRDVKRYLEVGEAFIYGLPKGEIESEINSFIESVHGIQDEFPRDITIKGESIATTLSTFVRSFSDRISEYTKQRYAEQKNALVREKLRGENLNLEELRKLADEATKLWNQNITYHTDDAAVEAFVESQKDISYGIFSSISRLENQTGETLDTIRRTFPHVYEASMVNHPHAFLPELDYHFSLISDQGYTRPEVLKKFIEVSEKEGSLDKYFPVLYSYLTASIAFPLEIQFQNGQYQVRAHEESERQQHLMESGNGIWNMLNEGEKSSFIKFVVWAQQSLEDKRRRAIIDAKYAAEEDDEKEKMDEEIHEFSSMQKTLRGLLSGYSENRENNDKRKSSLLSFISSITDPSYRGIESSAARETIKELRNTLLDQLEGTSTTVEEFLRENEVPPVKVKKR